MKISPTLKDLKDAEMVDTVISLICSLALAESGRLSKGLAVFEGHSLLQPPLPSKVIKLLFLFIPNSVFMLYFGSKARRLVFDNSSSGTKYEQYQKI